MQTHLNGKAHKPQVAFDDQPPRPGPALFVKRLKGNESVTCVILGTQLYGVWAHWSGKKSEPHFSDPSSCPGCMSQKAKRWKGYLHVLDLGGNRELILELTPASAQQLKRELGRSTELRGERLRVARSAGDNGRISITVLAAVQKVEALPKAKDPRPTILNLWGLNDEDGDGWIEGEGEGEEESRFKL